MPSWFGAKIQREVMAQLPCGVVGRGAGDGKVSVIGMRLGFVATMAREPRSVLAQLSQDECVSNTPSINPWMIHTGVGCMV